MRHTRVVLLTIGLVVVALGTSLLVSPDPVRPSDRSRQIPAPTTSEWNDTGLTWLTARARVGCTVMPDYRAELRAAEFRLSQHKLTHGDPRRRWIALTFDDGPHPDFTPRLLRLLAQYRVPATFFVVGTQAEQHPGLIREIVKDGHSLGNHTYHHVNLTRVPVDYQAAELQACGDVLERITGRRTPLFRPPGGDYNRNVLALATTMRYMTVLWTDNTGDFARPAPDIIIDRAMKKRAKGGIILLHDGVESDLRALPRLITALRAEDYEFVTIDTLLSTCR